jgi:hypothetical protein
VGRGGGGPPPPPGNRDKVGLMRLEKAEKGGEQPRLASALSQFGRGEAAQGQKALGQAFFLHNGAEGAQRKELGFVCLFGQHGLISSWHERLGNELAKILIVEDNALNIKLFCDLLAAHGHEPQAVTDSRQALDAAREFSPDLVITDIQLPHINGLELIRMVRECRGLSRVRAVNVCQVIRPTR